VKKKELSFDKFIKDIEKRESIAAEKVVNHQAGQEDHPRRIYNKLYRERWSNRIVYRRK
jgi:hypothetical protein